MKPPLWMRLLRLYGRNFPIHRGKARLAKLAFRRLPLPDRPFVAAVHSGIKIELWPWLWEDFCTYINGSAELYVLHYFRSLIHEHAVVLDVGAYIGIYALTAGAVATHGQVVAFEPDPRSARRLANALAVNNIKHVHLCQCAAGDRPDTLQLSLGAYPFQSSLQRKATPSIEEQVMVPQVTIDDYCAEMNLSRIDVMKIDTEGAELNVLRGASGIIASARPILIVELHRQQSGHFGYTVEDTLDHIRNLAYTLFQVEPGWLGPRLQPFSFRPGESRALLIARPT